MGKPTMWFPNRSDTNRPVQSQKMARSLKFWIQVEEELYYPSSENKGADQLRGYREADLRLCFRLCRLLVFPWGGSNCCIPFQFIGPAGRSLCDQMLPFGLLVLFLFIDPAGWWSGRLKGKDGLFPANYVEKI